MHFCVKSTTKYLIVNGFSELAGVYSKNMKSLLYVGGPLVLFLGFSLWSDAITFGEQAPGMVHFGGQAIVQQDTYMCDEGGGNCVLVDSTIEVKEAKDTHIQSGVSQSANYRLEEQHTGFSDVSGLEIEQEAIEYRDGSEPTYVRKQPGLQKYANITMRRPTGFDWTSWKFIFEREAAIQRVKDEYDEKFK